jgi:hypothetical protein
MGWLFGGTRNNGDLGFARRKVVGKAHDDLVAVGYRDFQLVGVHR